MKTANMEQKHREQINQVWRVYDRMVKRGDVTGPEWRDEIEERCYQIGILEGLRRADALISQTEKEARS